MEKNKKAIIIAAGNPLRKDDGVGYVLLNILQKDEALVDFEFEDVGTNGLNILDYIKGYQKAIIIDAVQMNAKPGDFRLFSPKEVKTHVKSDALSTHGVGIAEVIELYKELNMGIDLKIFGIQPKDVSFGEGLSDEVSSKLQRMTLLLKKELLCT